MTSKKLEGLLMKIVVAFIPWIQRNEKHFKLMKVNNKKFI